MLESLISSKTRLKLLIKFFIDITSNSHLRGLANEYNDSTNSIRLELNNLSEAGYLIKKKVGNKVKYLANSKHPLFDIIIKLVRKHTGIENIISNILASIDNIKAIYLLGDYAKGVDSGTIKIYIKAKINDKAYIEDVLKKTEKKINRKILLVKKIDPFEDKLLIYENK
tara:strand:- start:1640 stop:2146 length:507 start_codon:yes stop_codon:yes gene_type:complete